MNAKTMKTSFILTVLCLLMLFFLMEKIAWSATPIQAPSQQVLSNSVKTPMPSKPGASTTGTLTKLSGLDVSPKTATLNPNGTPASCPLNLSTGPKGDIRDIRGPIHIPDPRLWVFYTLGGILLLFLAWAFWKWLGKQRSLRSKTDFEIAFEELEKAKALINPEMAERFSVMVSKTIRTYIENRFGIRVTKKTTHEFITRVAAEPSSELNPHSEPLREFLGHCDLAKFARQTLSQEQMEKMVQSAWRFVDETRPQPEGKKVEKRAAPINDDTRAAEKIKDNISGKKRFFRGRLKGGFKWTIRKNTGGSGFNSTHQVVTAGGR